MAKLLNCFLILSCLLTLSASAQDLRQYFKGVEGCFVLYDLKNDRYLRYNVEFLKAFYQGRLPVSKRSLDIVKEIITLEQTDSYKLIGKTGGGPIGERSLGWFVGYLEKKGNVYIFALNIEGKDALAVRDERINLTKRILGGVGY